ncbi:LINE-1 retrotransposable element ORF2 protein [Vitis vinifera]|uniref:LINE-1 retrotransposable element ORF2 protein n=1 Tax=Vitis vinifera TaxID=29760 RepID=A0A438C1R7_VITVI|nr:LINE-1 retrotransposable element ORF2 protein [Vitis vinifera]
MFKEFHEQNTFLKSLNNTFLVLIPKKGGAEDIGDFRPISLLGRLYKLLAKVLANRLKKVIGKVVSPAQNAFVMGRRILDASLIANETIDLWQKRKEKGVICKLDIEKAYDSMNWQFLMKVLQKMGFGPKWLGWMWSCISSAKFSILVNGVPAGFFPSSKGLRQGDPLSPYLFVMGMEVLGALIRRAVEGGFLSGCNIREGGRTALNISHLFFADDTIVFCEANKDHLSHLSWILFWFEADSGLKINLGKSEIIPVGAPNKASSVWDGVEAGLKVAVSVIDSGGPEAHRSRYLGSVSGQHAFGEKLGLCPLDYGASTGDCRSGMSAYMITGGKSLQKFHNTVCPDCKPIRTVDDNSGAEVRRLCSSCRSVPSPAGTWAIRTSRRASSTSPRLQDAGF